MKKYVVLLAVVLFLVTSCAWGGDRNENGDNVIASASENAYVHDARDGGGGGRDRGGDGGDGEYGPNDNNTTSRDITSNDNSVKRSGSGSGGGCNSGISVLCLAALAAFTLKNRK